MNQTPSDFHNEEPTPIAQLLQPLMKYAPCSILNVMAGMYEHAIPQLHDAGRSVEAVSFTGVVARLRQAAEFIHAEHHIPAMDRQIEQLTHTERNIIENAPNGGMTQRAAFDEIQRINHEPPQRVITLVACCGRKLHGKHKAKDIYQSQLFLKARAVAERNSTDWFILSANYGLIHPDQEIEYYDQRLNSKSRQERMEWAGHVADQIAQHITGPTQIVMLAGMDYRRFIPHLIARVTHPLVMDFPLEGLGIGEQLSYLTKWLRGELAR